MSDRAVRKSPADRAPVSHRGQSLVEFALVMPMLLALLLGIADFGRAFRAGIALEAAARDAAEVGAIERLRNGGPPDLVADPDYYDELHEIIAEVACKEMEVIPAPETTAGPECPQLSAIRVCVHDGIDPRCGQPVPGYDAPVAEGCSELYTAAAPPWPNTSGGDVGSHFVEVHACYQFTTLFDLDLSLPMNTGLSLGDVYLQRARSFVVDCPPGAVSTC